MARQSKPWFRVSKNTWYITLNGRKLSLGVRGEENHKQAFTAWHRLMGELPLETPQKPRQTPSTPPAEPQAEVKPASVQDVITAFLADAEGRMTPGCLRNYRISLLPFADRHGTRDAESLTVSEAEAYARKPEWSASYRNGMLGSLVTAYRWAERGQVISEVRFMAFASHRRLPEGQKPLSLPKPIPVSANTPMRSFGRSCNCSGSQGQDLARSLHSRRPALTSHKALPC